MTFHACICCNSSDWEIIPYRDGINYLRCKKCDYYMHEQVDHFSRKDKFENEQKKFYSEDSLVLSPIYKFFQNEINFQRISVIQDFMIKASKLIEIGPGSGELIGNLIQRDYSITAVEHSGTLAKELVKKFGIKIYVGDFESQDYEDNLYDAYLSFHVIEHVPDVLKHLKKAGQITKPNGYAFIATPNTGGWEHNLPFMLSPNYDSAHLQLFSEKALSLCLEKSGWEVITIKTPEYSLSWLRVLTNILRKVKNKQNTNVGGEYIRSFNPKLKALIYIYRVLSLPLRKFQEYTKRGNELFIIAKRKD